MDVISKIHKKNDFYSLYFANNVHSKPSIMNVYHLVFEIDVD